MMKVTNKSLVFLCWALFWLNKGIITVCGIKEKATAPRIDPSPTELNKLNP